MNRLRVLAVSLILASLLGIWLNAVGSAPLVGQDRSPAEQYRAEKLARLRGEQYVSGTVLDGSRENRFEEERLRQDRQRQRLRRLQEQGIEFVSQPSNTDVGDIAVIQDDGTLVAPANPFDLNRRTVLFTPVLGGGYDINVVPVTFDSDVGVKLTGFRGSADPNDDGFVEVRFNDGFTFPFFGQNYARMFVGTDGHITFVRGEVVQPSVTGLLRTPRVAAFWRDLNPGRVSTSASAGIFFKQLSDRVVVTYQNVPAFESGRLLTFQVSLFSSGLIDLSYSRVLERTALVGISPGRTSEQHLVDLTEPPTTTLSGLIYEDFRALNEVAVFSVPSVFYRTHGDDYDFIYVWTDFPYDLGNAFAFYSGVRNEIQGIGQPLFNRASSFGSAGRLQGLLVLNDIVSAYPSLPTTRFLGLNSSLSILGQEQGHRWLSFIRYPGNDPGILLGRQQAHWSFFLNIESTSAFSTSAAPRSSSNEGNVWIDNGDGTFTTPPELLIDGFSPLDQYLIGVRAAEEVPDTFVIENPQTNISREAAPRAGVTVRGTRKNITIGEIIRANGVRIPSVEAAQKEWRVAFVLVARAGFPPSQETLNKLDLFRTSWEAYFNQAIDGRGRLTTELVK